MHRDVEHVLLDRHTIARCVDEVAASIAADVGPAGGCIDCMIVQPLS